jgi:type I restriction enzyme M protein
MPRQSSAETRWIVGYEHLEDFIAAFQPEDRSKRVEGERFKELRDKVSLDLIWLRDESLEDSDNLPPPDVLAQEIVEDLEAGGCGACGCGD